MDEALQRRLKEASPEEYMNLCERYCLPPYYDSAELTGGGFRTYNGDMITRLAVDIATHGQKLPVSITEDLRVIDGWLRVEACKRLGIPVFTVMVIEEAIVSANIIRTHSSTVRAVRS